GCRGISRAGSRRSRRARWRGWRWRAVAAWSPPPKLGAETMSSVYGELRVFTGNANPALAERICRYIGIPLERAEVFEFTNENIFVRILESVRENDVFVV